MYQTLILILLPGLLITLTCFFSISTFHGLTGIVQLFYRIYRERLRARACYRNTGTQTVTFTFTKMHAWHHTLRSSFYLSDAPGQRYTMMTSYHE